MAVAGYCATDCGRINGESGGRRQTPSILFLPKRREYACPRRRHHVPTAASGEAMNVPASPPCQQAIFAEMRPVFGNQ